jgi:hypothetical protein
MIKLILLGVIIFVAVTLKAQETFLPAEEQSRTDSYLKKIPILPKYSCDISKEAAESFQFKVADVIEQIENEIESINIVLNSQSTINENAIKEHAMHQISQQYGLSPTDISNMESGKMSDAEKQALANQILQQQTNMSMSEVENFSKMSEAGKKAYSEALGIEIMATQQVNQNETPVNNTFSNMYEFVREQQAVMNKLNATSQNIIFYYNDIEGDPDLQKMRRNIETWHSEIMAMSGINYGQEKQMDSLSLLIKNAQIQICEIYTPKYHSAIRNHFSLMKSSFPDQRKLAEITASLQKTQLGIDMPAESIEIGELASIIEYLNKLKDAYQFKSYYSEDYPE